MRSPTRRELLLALVLSVPPGVGMTGFVGFLREELLSVTAIAVGFLVWVVLFSLILGGVVVGEPTDAGFDLPDDHNR
jgi:predicted transporter